MTSPSTSAWRPAPAALFAAGAALALAVFALLAWVATSWPWLGLTLVPEGDAIRVEAVDPAGPSAGRLQPGDVLVALEGAGGRRVALQPVLIARATYVLPSYAALDAFVEAHRQLHAALRAGPVQIEKADGRRVTVRAAATRALAALPADFWAPALLAAAMLLLGAGMLAFAPWQPVTLFFAASGIAYCGTLGTMAVALGREISFDGQWANALWSVNQAARLASHWALLMVFWTYPRPFRPLRWSAPVAAAFLLAGVANELRWWPRPFMAAPLAAALTVLVAMPLLTAWQWRASRGQPLERAAVKVMLVSFAGPAVVLISLNQVPNMLWHRPVIESAAAIAAISTLTYFGCLVGIARHRLFNLDRWFFEALFWALGGLLVVLLDAALLWFNASMGLALGGALLVAGWLYFPLRQWLWRRFHPGARQTLEQHLPRLVDGLFGAASAADLAADWQRLLAEVFAPLRLQREAAEAAAPALASQGQGLRVPSLVAGESFLLEHAEKGQRLFGPEDVALAAGLLALTRRAAEARRTLDAQSAERSARQREKEAMLQDLHDGLGGLATNIRMLAAVGQRAPAHAVPQTLGTIAELADESLSEIRSFMYSLDESEADWSALAADLRAFGRKLVEPHGPAFAFEAAIAPEAPPPDSLLRLNLARICKEALHNAVKHAQASRIGVDLVVRPDGLQLRVHDDGVGLPPALREAGAAPGRSRGLANLRRRAEQLGGTLRFEPGPGTTLHLELPLPVKSPVPGIAPDPLAA
ncbi:MAG: ATP-binding protein [Rubrivivax sp.]